MSHLVVVRGGDKSLRNMSEKLTRFAIKELLPTVENLDILVMLQPRVKSGASGICSDEVTAPGTFKIRVCCPPYYPKPIKFIADTILHEMVHVKQLYTKQLVSYSNNTTWWKGKKAPISLVSVAQQMSLSDDLYYKQPWEKEAKEVAKRLTNKAWEKGLI